MTKRLPEPGPPAPFDTRPTLAHDASVPPPQSLEDIHSPSTICGSFTPPADLQSIEMANAIDVLTHGCLRQITEDQSSVAQPIVQCVQIKPMAGQNGMQRFRVVMSDSVNFMQGMLGQRECPVFGEKC